MIFKNIFKKKRNQDLYDTFGKFICKDKIDEIVSGAAENTDNYRKQDVEYCIVRIKDDELEKIPDYIKTVLNSTCAFENVTINELFASYILITFGQLYENSDFKRIRMDVVNEISRKCNSYAAVIHGKKNCLCGNFGNERGMSYGVVTSGFSDLIKKLNSMDYGQIREI